MVEEDPKPTGDEKPEVDRKRLYSTPRLIRHGSIEQITKAAGATGADGLAGSSLV